MVEALSPIRPTDETLGKSSRVPIDARKQEFARMLNGKVEQGYRIESQGDTEAVLFTRGRRRWFGLAEGGDDSRRHLSIDEQGHVSNRGL